MTDRVTIRTALLGDAPNLAVLSGVLGYPVVDETLALRLGNLLSWSPVDAARSSGSW